MASADVDGDAGADGGTVRDSASARASRHVDDDGHVEPRAQRRREVDAVPAGHEPRHGEPAGVGIDGHQHA